MYYVVLIVLLIGSLIEIYRRKKYKQLFLLIYVVMTLMAIFRFGQLGDYFDYYYLYHNPILLRDPLFIVYAMAFQLCNASYQFFLTITELICFGLAFPFFYKTCRCSCISLLVFYCYSFLTCPMSALRQAVCLSMLLCSYSMLVEKKRVLFFLIVGIGSLIHLSFFAVALIGLFYDKRFFNRPIIIVIALLATGVMLSGIDLTAVVISRVGFENRSISEVSSGAFDNLIQLALRLALMVPLLFFKPAYGTNGYYAKAICLIGYILYCLLASQSLVAGRIEYFFRTFLCLFVAELSRGLGSKYSFISVRFSPRRKEKPTAKKAFSNMRVAVLSLFVLAHVVLFYKNMGGFIAQGAYKENVTIFNFPYISIFDKQAIDQYTDIDKYDYSE